MDFISILSIFVLACFVGYYVVWSVTPALHTPLMAVTNAISSVIIVGALVASAEAGSMAAKYLGLLAVGAGLRFAVLRTGWPALLLSNALKLVALPALTVALAVPLGLTGVPLAVAVLFNALPSSASSYVFARQLGGDHELMAAILTTQVIMAAVTLPAFVAFV